MAIKIKGTKKTAANIKNPPVKSKTTAKKPAAKKTTAKKKDA